MEVLYKKTKHWVLLITAIIVIIGTIFVLSGRALTPLLNRYLPNFENWISQSFNQPVKIGKASISWSGYEPGLAFEEVRILNKETLQPSIDIHHIKLSINIFRSLLMRQFVLDKLRISGVHLIVHEQANGEYNIGGLYGFSVNDRLTGATLETNKVLTWIFSQPKLWLREVEIRYVSLQEDVQSILFNIALRNKGAQHSMKGEAILQQQLPTKIQFNVNWNGIVDDLTHTQGKIFLSVEDLSLPQWIEQYQWRNWQIKQGMGNVKLWIEWQNDVLRNLQSQFQLYNLALQSPQATAAQVIPRLGGKIEWHRDGENQILIGKNVSINLSNHLWPKTNFSIQLIPIQTGGFAIKSIEISYLDLADTQKWLLLSGLLPKEWEDPLLNLNPHGEITRCKAEVPIDINGNWEKAIISTNLINISFNSWQHYPSVKNLSGEVNWTQDQRSVSLTSKGLIIDYQKLFTNPFQFTNASGQLDFNKSKENQWTLSTTNLQLTNPDITVNARFTLNLNDISHIDLKSNFSIHKAENIIHYLPTQIFAADLTAWLKQAFHSGQVSSGEAEIKGSLNEFPFTKNNGKFWISGIVDNLEFSYDTQWPMLHKLNGKLVFSGDSMFADADNGLINGVPFSKTHAELTHLFEAGPAVLTVQSNFASSLTKGLYFINHSPLQKQFGKVLGNLTLTGPMNLKLGLTIPIAKPTETKVEGNLLLSQYATLNLPEWDISLEKLHGSIRFTEDSITANNLLATLFGETATINFVTQELANKQKLIQVNLESQIKIAELQRWLKVSLDKIVQGVMHYQLKIDLPPRATDEPLHLALNSNLNGVAVNLPSPYQKTASSEKPFKFESYIKPLQILQMKLNYNNITAAITAKQEKKELELIGGEIHFGEGEADWQVAPGFIITGRLDQFNWQTWQGFFDSLGSKKTLVKVNKEITNWWRSIDVVINQLKIFDLSLKQIRVQISRISNAWQIRLANANLQGQLSFPMNLTRGSIIDARFQQFYWPLDDTINPKKWDPKTFPRINFIGEDVRYGDKGLGRIIFNSSPTSTGLAINTLKMDSSVINLEAQGSWRLLGDQYQTHLSGRVTTREVNKLLDAWGATHTNLVASTGDVHFDLNWPDAPYSPKIASMSGTVSVKFGEGRIIDLGSSNNAKIGIGRMLSILNLQTLPRRLTLNFSDLVEKGYSFDNITGNFSLRNGSAFTQNMKLNGPVAKIEILGRVGLGAKDYDLNMSITPYVTSSLPLVATIAGGPLAGMATWAVDKVVSKVVSKAVTYYYKVTGSWENPVWESVGATKK